MSAQRGRGSESIDCTRHCFGLWPCSGKVGLRNVLGRWLVFVIELRRGLRNCSYADRGAGSLLGLGMCTCPALCARRAAWKLLCIWRPALLVWPQVISIQALPPRSLDSIATIAIPELSQTSPTQASYTSSPEALPPQTKTVIAPHGVSAWQARPKQPETNARNRVNATFVLWRVCMLLFFKN